MILKLHNYYFYQRNRHCDNVAVLRSGNVSLLEMYYFVFVIEHHLNNSAVNFILVSLNKQYGTAASLLF